MFDSITSSFKGAINKLRFSDDERTLKKALDHLKKSLLKADVHFKTVKVLLSSVESKAKANPIGKHNFIVALKESLMEILVAAGNQGFVYSPKGLTTVVMAGLQGAGKTTTVGKLANYLKQKNKKVLVCAADLQRLAAVEQLKQICESIDVDVFFDDQGQSPAEVAFAAQAKAQKEQYDVLLIDTAGRTAIDESLMEELLAVCAKVNPDEKFYVADSMTGHDASKTASTFHDRLHITGVILSKYDGDSKGGIALSIAHQVGVPLRFVGIGEKSVDLEVFLPDRITSRFVGEGDLEGLAEKATGVISDQEIKTVTKKLKKGQFNFNDFLSQIDNIKNMGSLQSLMSMVPGMSDMKDKMANLDLDNSKEIKVFRSAIGSMTPKERENPDLLMKNNTRKRRIALGAGLEVAEINKMLKQFHHSSKMAKKLSSGGMKNLESMMAQMKGGQRPF